MPAASMLTECIHWMNSVAMSIPLTLLGLLEREPSHVPQADYDTYFGQGEAPGLAQTLARLTRDGRVETAREEPGAGPDPGRRGTITEQGVSGSESHHCAGARDGPRPGLQTVLFVQGGPRAVVGTRRRLFWTSSAQRTSNGCMSSRR